MILESLIQIISISLAFALLGTLLATFTYYARYKINNHKSSKTASVSNKIADWAMPEQAIAEPVLAAKKRLHFQRTNHDLKESVS